MYRLLLLLALLMAAPQAKAQFFNTCPGGTSPCAFVPNTGGVLASPYAQFDQSKYYYNGTSYSTLTAWLSAIGGTSTFARADCSPSASCSSYTNSSGLVAFAATNVARFDYNSTTLKPLGILLEPTSANVGLWARDWTQAAWTKSNATVAKDQTGADGTATSASSVLATAGNATVLQAVTHVSSADTYSVYIKRLVGTGVIDITLDGGSTWTDITSQINSSTYTRVNATQTVTNPSIGVRIVTNADKIAVDLSQLEIASTTTTAIPTTTVAVTRAIDVLNVGISPTTTFTAYVASNNVSYVSANPRFIDLDSATNSPILILDSTHPAAYNNASALNGPVFSGGWAANHKMIATGSPSGRLITVDAATPTSDANALASSSGTDVFVGRDGSQAQAMNGRISAVGFWIGTTINASEAQRLTSSP